MQLMARFPRSGVFIVTLTLLALATSARGQALEGFRHYFFLSDQRIVTVELINPQKAILNYINLGDTYEFLEAPGLLILDSDGGFFNGHVLEIEEAEDPRERFKVSELIQPHVYVGTTSWATIAWAVPPRRCTSRWAAVSWNWRGSSRETLILSRHGLEH